MDNMLLYYSLHSWGINSVDSHIWFLYFFCIHSLILKKLDRYPSFEKKSVWNGMVSIILSAYVCQFLKIKGKIPLLDPSLGLQNGLISEWSKYWKQNTKKVNIFVWSNIPNIVVVLTGVWLPRFKLRKALMCFARRHLGTSDDMEDPIYWA